MQSRAKDVSTATRWPSATAPAHLSRLPSLPAAAARRQRPHLLMQPVRAVGDRRSGRKPYATSAHEATVRRRPQPVPHRARGDASPEARGLRALHFQLRHPWGVALEEKRGSVCSRRLHLHRLDNCMRHRNCADPESRLRPHGRANVHLLCGGLEPVLGAAMADRGLQRGNKEFENGRNSSALL